MSQMKTQQKHKFVEQEEKPDKEFNPFLKGVDGDTLLAKFKAEYKITDGVLEESIDGETFSAVHKRSKKVVDVKFITGLDSFSKLKQVLREVSILKALSEMDGCRYIPRLRDVLWPKDGGNRDFIIIIMDHLEGMTLKQFIDRASRKEIELDEGMLSTIAYNLTSAVNFLHLANIIHRDLKPANIIIDSEYEIKIVDFSSARSNPSKTSLADIYKDTPNTKDEKKDLAKRLTRRFEEGKGQERDLSPHVQSRSYRAPEVALMENSYSFAVDIWSVGCIVAELIQSQAIYRKTDGNKQVLFKARSCHPLSPRNLLLRNQSSLGTDLLNTIL